MLQPSHLPRPSAVDTDITPRRVIPAGPQRNRSRETKDTFKTPLPRQPLAPSSSFNSSIMGESTPSSSRLKRLSLVAKSPTIGVEERNESDVTRGLKSPGMGAAGPSTPRRSLGMRSSISYSPAQSATRSSFEIPRTSRPIEEEVKPAEERGNGRHLRPDGDDKEKKKVEDKKRKKGETLVERHADLLTLIAQKERRVNELKEELASQEASLHQLKSRWTSLVTRQTPSSSSSSSSSSNVTRIRPSAHPHRTSMSTTSSTSSNLSSNPLSPSSDLITPMSPTSLDQSIANLLSGIPADKLLSGETIQEGKKFWDTLVKTVSAAASGNVPDDIPAPSTSSGSVGDKAQGETGNRTRNESRQGMREEEREYKSVLDGVGGSFDLSDLKGLLPAALPWTLTSPTQPPSHPLSADRTASTTQSTHKTQPLRPANSTRLSSSSRREDRPSSRASSLHSSPTESLLDAEEEEGEEGARTKVLTPKRYQQGAHGHTQRASEDGQSEDGWGW